MPCPMRVKESGHSSLVKVAFIIIRLPGAVCAHRAGQGVGAPRLCMTELCRCMDSVCAVGSGVHRSPKFRRFVAPGTASSRQRTVEALWLMDMQNPYELATSHSC